MKSLKKRPPARDNLKNYTEVDESFFTDVLKEFGNESDYLKIVENTIDKAKYYIWTKFLLGKNKKKK